jgi:transposase
MTALRPQRRIGTAREIGERFNRSPRTVRRIIAEPREEFEKRAHSRQDEALSLIESGLTYQQVADRLDITRGTAAGLVHRARRRRADADSTAAA